MKTATNFNTLLSTRLDRVEVERIAFDASTDERIARQFQTVLKAADAIINGMDDTFRAKVHPARILFINYPDGLKIYVD